MLKYLEIMILIYLRIINDHESSVLRLIIQVNQIACRYARQDKDFKVS